MFHVELVGDLADRISEQACSIVKYFVFLRTKPARVCSSGTPVQPSSPRQVQIPPTGSIDSMGNKHIAAWLGVADETGAEKSILGLGSGCDGSGSYKRAFAGNEALG